MKIRINLVHVFSLFVSVQFCESYNVLVIFGHPGKSHYDVFKPLFQELGKRGHNITIVSHVKTEGEVKNGRDVPISKQAITNHWNLSWFPGNHLQKYLETKIISDFADITCKSGLQSKELQDFLKQDHHFDVILVEFFNTNCFYGLINKFKAPFIGLSSCEMMPWHSQWFGASANPSYIPSVYMAYPSPMTFLERVENTIMHLGHKLWYNIFMEWPGTKHSKKYLGYEPPDPYNASLLLVNTHYSLHGVKSLPPAIVEVGGIHVVKKKPKPLPKNIEKWTNESKSGLIYFSLGSMIKGHTFPEEQLKIFLKVFSELPYRILWKWENETMKGKPDNLMLTEWAPQFDILCHPNTKLFIAHGGLLGATEAVHCGVPMLVMPQFGDQPLNAVALEKNGAGVILKLKEITEEKLRMALKKALSLETKQKASYLSQRFNDRLVSPLETSVYWVEHIAKYKGGLHMRSEAVDMPFYQYALLDVAVFLLTVILVLCFVVYTGLKFLLRCFRRKEKIKKA